MSPALYLLGPVGLLLVLAGFRTRRHNTGRNKVGRDDKGLFVPTNVGRWRIGGDTAKGRRDASILVGNACMFLGCLLLAVFALLTLANGV